MTENFDYYRKGENKKLIRTLIKREVMDDYELV